VPRRRIAGDIPAVIPNPNGKRDQSILESLGSTSGSGARCGGHTAESVPGTRHANQNHAPRCQLTRCRLQIAGPECR
jgi:hypothetical protein